MSSRDLPAPAGHTRAPCTSLSGRKHDRNGALGPDRCPAGDVNDVLVEVTRTIHGTIFLSPVDDAVGAQCADNHGAAARRRGQSFRHEGMTAVSGTSLQGIKTVVLFQLL